MGLYLPASRNWDGAGKGCTKAGYGQLSCRAVSNQPLTAHRVSWELETGQLPDKHVLHHCDNPRCVRLSHLFSGTQRDNNRDRDQKGRVASGDRNGARTRPDRNPFVRNKGAGRTVEQHHAAKLTWDRVRKIRADFATGEYTKADLARRENISQTVTGRVIKGTLWREDNGLAEVVAAFTPKPEKKPKKKGK